MQRNYDSHNDRGRFPTAVIAIVATVIVVAVIIMAVFAYFSSINPYGGYYGGMMGGGMMGGGMLFMIPIGLIVLFVIGYALWGGFGWGRGYGGDHYGHYSRYASADGERGSAMEILQRRYAKGEITKEQFEQMKKDINT